MNVPLTIEKQGDGGNSHPPLRHQVLVVPALSP